MHSGICSCEDFHIYGNICRHLHFLAQHFSEKFSHSETNDEMTSIQFCHRQGQSYEQPPPDLDFDDIVQTETEQGADESSSELKRLKDQMSIYICKLQKESNIVLLKENIELLKKMKFSDFEVKDVSKKRTLDKQDNFLCKRISKDANSNPSKMYECLLNPQTKECTDNLINDFLCTISKNFSSESFKVNFVQTSEGHKIYDSSDEISSYQSSANITFIPFYNEQSWNVIIVKNQRTLKLGKDELSFGNGWQSGYSVILRCLQELTNNFAPHSDKLIDNFVGFVKNIMMEIGDVMDYCYACYKKNAAINCSVCNLPFCKLCLKKPFVRKRCR